MNVLLSNTAIATELENDPRYREWVLEFQAKAEKALKEGVFEVKALGTSLTLPQIAITYQVYKGAPKSLGENARAFTGSISRECLAIIKKAGYKADWNAIQALASHA